MMLAAGKSVRCAVLSVVLTALVGCAAAPAPPKDVALKTDLQKPKHPSINASVLTDASVLDYSFAASLDPSVETVTRLESTYTLKLSDDDERLRVGDAVSSSGQWGSTVRYGGVQFGTRLSPSEDVLYSQRLATSGLAVLPTAADALFASIGDTNDVWSSQNLSAGAPKINAQNAVNFTASDSFGRSEALSAPLVAQARLVESGCSDFSLGLGKVRRDYAVTSNDYGPVFANSTIACAAPLGFTIEGHGEYLAEEVTALGLGLARRLGSVGTASMAFASSDTEVGSGWLARVGFEHQSSLLSLAMRSRIQSREFREVGSVWVDDPIMRRNLASVGLNVSETASVALAYAEQTTWQRERADIISLNQKMSVGRGSISMTAGHSLAEEIGSSFFLSYKRPFGAPARRARFDASDLELLEVTLTQRKGLGGG
jgi:outer membrane usher protein FimD/PapC